MANIDSLFMRMPSGISKKMRDALHFITNIWIFLSSVGFQNSNIHKDNFLLKTYNRLLG